MALRKYGWIRDTPDFRDTHFTPEPLTEPRPAFVDLRPRFSPVFDQESLGSCVANALAGAVKFDLIKQNKITPTVPVFIPSRLFLYYNARRLGGNTASDNGSTIRDGVKAVATWGAPPEPDWLYVPKNFSTPPPQQAYTDALRFRAVSYQRVAQNAAQMKTCLVKGFGFTCGFTAYASFESEDTAKTGIVRMPMRGEERLGGHAVVCVGYNDFEEIRNGVPPGHYIIRNSFGPGWGVKGYGFIPQRYLEDPQLAADFWMIETVA